MAAKLSEKILEDDSREECIALLMMIGQTQTPDQREMLTEVARDFLIPKHFDLFSRQSRMGWGWDMDDWGIDGG